MLRGMIFFNTNLERERGAQRDDFFFNTNLEREREGLRGMIFLNTNLERERGAEPASRREPSLWSQQKGEARSDM